MSSHERDWAPEDSDEEQKAGVEETSRECLKWKAKEVKLTEIKRLGYQADVQAVEVEIAHQPLTV